MYFDAYARGEGIRILLAHAKVNFEDNRIEFKDWPALKATMPGGQIPVWVEDGV